MVSSHVFPEVIGFYFYNLVVNDGSACFMQVVRREPGFGGRHINHLSGVELQLCDLVVGSQIVTEGDLPQKKTVGFDLKFTIGYGIYIMGFMEWDLMGFNGI